MEQYDGYDYIGRIQLDNVESWGLPYVLEGVYICKQCAAIVVDPQQHNRYHNLLILNTGGPV